MPCDKVNRLASSFVPSCDETRGEAMAFYGNSANVPYALTNRIIDNSGLCVDIADDFGDDGKLLKSSVVEVPSNSYAYSGSSSSLSARYGHSPRISPYDSDEKSTSGVFD
ncbi:unnamed protein product [Notodromas monacha]|uniref:Uncharacterized protein n=1 Tax=Notodromas monacha TaxID=399045 RepID=A0A7R9BIJ1_9CRUS|nr:unnamed protein product [Notodromas monacha]CAG0916162.1 unnamed protein product [Notodromas monacha]